MRPPYPQNISSEDYCRSEIDRMLQQSQTKVIFPLMTLGLLQQYQQNGQTKFIDAEVRKAYHWAVNHMEQRLGHNLHIGGKYYDAYPSRNLPRYGVVKAIDNKMYEIEQPYLASAEALISWIPERVEQHIINRIGIVPKLGNHAFRSQISAEPLQFLHLLEEHIDKNATNFEIFSFAVIRVHLEKFACKIYRDTRTSAHDSGVDISTNFGVVYQIKKLKIFNKAAAQNLYAELKLNFDNQRLNDGNVILVIDDISKDVKQFLIDMKIQSISKSDLLKLASQFEDMEDREKVLRIVHNEFRREYESRISGKKVAKNEQTTSK